MCVEPCFPQTRSESEREVFGDARAIPRFLQIIPKSSRGKGQCVMQNPVWRSYGD